MSVEVNAANMELYIFTNPNSRGEPLDLVSTVTLVDDTMYFVDCVVKRATPPIDLSVHFQGVTWGRSVDETEGATLAELINY